MAQRGLAAAFRAIFGPRQQQQQQQQTPHPAPPDDLSAPSRYDTDASSYEYEEIIPEPPQTSPPPPQPGPAAQPHPSAPLSQHPAPDTPPAKTSVDQKNTAKTPRLLRRLGVDVSNLPSPTPDDASSHYSLRPRRRRKPGAPEPRGVETSRATPDDPSHPPSAPPDNAHSISLRPSLAARQDKQRDAPKPVSDKPKPGPRLPAPSAATTSAIVARPDFVAVGNLDEASTATLRALCKKVGIPAIGTKKELKERALAKLGERKFLNEDTMIMDSDGNPRALGNAPLRTLPGQRASPTPQKGDGERNDAAAHAKKNGEHLTTTTMNRTPGRSSASPPANVVPSETPLDARQLGKEGDTAKGGFGGIVAKSSCAAAAKPAPQPVNLHLEIPRRDSNVVLAGPSDAFPTLSSTGVGAPGDMPPSPAFGIHPVSSPYALGLGLSAQGKMADAGGDPTESVDARGGGNQEARKVRNQIVDMDSMFGAVARGNRHLNHAEYEVCLKALNENYWAGTNKRNVDAAALLSARGAPGTQATLPRNSATANQLGPRFGSQLPDATMPGPRGSFSAIGAAGASAAMRAPQIPPVPPNTPGVTTSGSLLALDKINVPVSSTVHGAAAVLRKSQADVELDASMEKASLPDGLQAGIATEAEDIENAIASERNLRKDRSVNLERGGTQKPPISSVPSLKPKPETEGDGEATITPTTAVKPNQINQGAQNPFEGKFAGAIGGPAAHNTVGLSCERGIRDDHMKDIGEDEPRPESDIPTARDQPEAGISGVQDVESRPNTGFTTPREVIRSFNRHGVDGTANGCDNMDGSGSQPGPAQASNAEVKDVLRSRGACPRPNESSLPRHLMGFSAIGRLDGAPSRLQEDNLPGQSERITRLSSLRPGRRPSASAGGPLVNLRRSIAGHRNSHIAEKLRKQRSLSERPKNPPLSAKTLRILEELKKVREENRSHSTNKRTRSPMPVPPSVMKRARLTGEFTKGIEKSQMPDTPKGMESLNQIGSQLNSRGSGSARQSGAGSRWAESQRLKVTPVSTKKRRPIAYGSGRKRSRATSLSSAALAEMQSLVDRDQGSGKGMPRAKGARSPPKFTFGQQLVDTHADGKKGITDHGELSPKRTPLAPPSFRTQVGTPPDTGIEVSRGEKRSRIELGSDEVSGASMLPVASKRSTSGSEPPLSVDAQQSEKKVPEKPPFSFGRVLGEKHVQTEVLGEQIIPTEVPSSQQGRDKLVTQKDEARAESGAFPLSSQAPSVGAAYGTGVPFKLHEPKSLKGYQPSGIGKPTFEAVTDSLTDKGVPSAPFGLSNGEEAPGPVASGSLAILIEGNEKKPPEADSEAKKSQTLSSAPPNGRKDTDAKDHVKASTTVKEMIPEKPLVAAFGKGPIRALDASVSEPLQGETPKNHKNGADKVSAPSLNIMEDVGSASKANLPPPSFNFGSVGDASFGALRPPDAKDGDANKVGEASDAGKPAGTGYALLGSTSARPSSSAFAAPANEGMFGSKLNTAEEKQHEEGRKLSLPKLGDKSATAAAEAASTAAPATEQLASRTPLAAQADKSRAEAPLPQAGVDGSTSRQPQVTTGFGGAKLGVASSMSPTVHAPSELKQVSSAAAPAATLPSETMTIGNAEPPGGSFGMSAVGTSSAKPMTPFVFGSNVAKDEPTTSMSASLKVPTDSSTPFGVLKTTPKADHDASEDTMKASTTPPTGKFTLFDGDKAAVGPPGASNAGKTVGPLFGQPASSPSLGAFGGASGSASSSGGHPLGGFTFGAPKQQVEVDPNGPFGATPFTPLSSVPKASTFVFGASASKAAATPASLDGATVGAQDSGPNLAGGFGSGFQKPSSAFGSAAAFSATPQFGASQSRPATSGGPFGAPTLGPGGSASPFGSSQPVLSGAAAPFGATQPGLAVPSTGTQPSFGTGIGSAPTFGGFGGAGKAQPSSTGFGGPFGQSNLLEPAAAESQPGAASTPAPSFSFGAPSAGAGSAGGAFNIGAAPSASQQAVRRPRKILRGRRTFR